MRIINPQKYKKSPNSNQSSFYPSFLKYIAWILLFGAGLLVWKRFDKSSSEISKVERQTDGTFTSTSSSLFSPSDETSVSLTAGAETPRALSLPSGMTVADVIETETKLKRALSGDDVILITGGVLRDTASAHDSNEVISRETRLESITAKDWQGQANLLINEIRAARGFQVPLDQIEALLSGKELYGWPEGQRNWIGDEMMTMLRQEVPKEAYRIFQQVLADTSAPSAMRDYSIQHISHMVTANQLGAEGVAVIRAALDSGDPIYASTSLISLHRLSEETPQWVSSTEVQAAAKRHQGSTDQRLQATSVAILKDAKQ